MKQGKLLFFAALGLGTIAVAGLATAAYAQRDPAYAAARAAGQIGEQPDGYIGVVGAATPDLRALVNNINNQRKAAYTKPAARGATVEQMAVSEEPSVGQECVSTCRSRGRPAHTQKKQNQILTNRILR